MEVVGLALSVVGLAGPLSKACISGYELLRATTTTAEDAGDFRLRVDTEMGLLNLWIKHWVNQRTGRIRGSAEVGEEVCFLAIDILAKIGSLLVDAGKLHGKYGIQIRRGTGLSAQTSQSDLVAIGRVGTTISLLTTPRSENAGPSSQLEILKEDEKGLTVTTKILDDRTMSDISQEVQGKTAGPQGPTGKGKNKESKFRRFLRKAGCLKSSGKKQAESSTKNPIVPGMAASPERPNLARSTTKVVTETVVSFSSPKVDQNEGTKLVDVAHAPVEEVFATLQSTKVEVEDKLTKVQRLKWVMMDKEKANELANDLKGWNERLFALLPPRRLMPRSSRKNRHYTIPQRASPLFTGRDKALSVLEEAFFGQIGEDDDDDMSTHEGNTGDRQRRAVLYGLGGAGKTQIALKFAEDNRDRFDSIFWINSSTVGNVEESFREIAELLRLPVGSSSNFVGAVKNRLAQLRDKNWLLIFDNADDISLVPFLPQGNHGSILITSRNPKARQHLGPLDQPACLVDEMSPDEAVELLLKAAGVFEKESTEGEGVENRAHAGKIVEKLGYLALAIDQAGAYICNNASLPTYLECYENFRADLLDMREYEASGYAYPVYQTWEISFETVKKKSPAAAELLQVLGHLHYEKIPAVIFEAGFTESATTSTDDESHPLTLNALKSLLQKCFITDGSGAPKWKSFHFDNAINQLTSYSLIKRHQPSIVDQDLSVTYSLHPLVHAWIRDRKVSEVKEKIAVQGSTISLLRNTILQSTGPTAYAMRSHLIAHIDFWILPSLEGVTSVILGPTERSQMRSIEAFAIVYHEVGRLQIAIRLRERVLSWRTENLSPAHHPDIITARSSLAETYRRATTELSKALRLATETVELLSNSPEYGPDHPMTLTAKLSLGSTLSDAGDRTGCEKLEREVIASRVRVLGPEHLDVAVARGNLGVSLLRLRRYPSAEVELRAAFSRRLSILGEKHPGTLLSMGNLAGALRGQGKYEEAIILGKRVVEIREGLLGERHQDVAKAKANYGYTLMSAGKLEEARKLEQEAFDQLESILGSYHGSTMDTLSNLAQVYLKLMDVEQVPEVVQKTESVLLDLVDRKTLVFGTEHKSTVEAVKLLTAYYEKVGRQHD